MARARQARSPSADRPLAQRAGDRARACGSPITSITRRRIGSGRRSRRRSAFLMSSPRRRSRRSAPADPGTPAIARSRRRCAAPTGDRAQPGGPRVRPAAARAPDRWYDAGRRSSMPRPMRQARASAGPPLRLITVAMMRPGDKLASYRLLGAALGAAARSRLDARGDRRRPGAERGRARRWRRSASA